MRIQLIKDHIKTQAHVQSLKIETTKEKQWKHAKFLACLSWNWFPNSLFFERPRHIAQHSLISRNREFTRRQWRQIQLPFQTECWKGPAYSPILPLHCPFPCRGTMSLSKLPTTTAAASALLLSQQWLGRCHRRSSRTSASQPQLTSCAAWTLDIVEELVASC